MKTFVVTYFRDADHARVREQLERNGAYICAVITVPFWSIYGQRLSDQFAVIYQSQKEIDVEVLC